MNLIIRTIILIITSIACGILFESKNWVLFGFLIFTIIIQVVILNSIFLKLNEKVAYFFKSIKNRDSSLVYNENIGGKAFRELHESLNYVNKLIQKNNIESQNNEQFYRSLLNHAATGLISFDISGRIVEINHTAKRLLPIYYARNIKDFQELDDGLPDFIWQLQTGEPKIYPLKVDGQLQQLMFKVSKLTQGKTELRLLSIENIKPELDQKELDSWVRLIRVMTHEIMNSIAPVISMADTANQLLVHKGDTKSSDNYSDETINDALYAIKSIKEQTTGLKKFVETYRQLTRLPKPEFQRLLVKEFLTRMIFILKEVITKQIETEIEVRPPNLHIMADEELLARVIYNLGLNAIQAIEQSGKGSKLQFQAYQNNYNHVVIKITDDGPGMKPEVLEKAFIPFYTTKKEGSGIGLSLCQQIMNLHKGEINLDSKEGLGTSFVLRF